MKGAVELEPSKLTAKTLSRQLGLILNILRLYSSKAGEVDRLRALVKLLKDRLELKHM